VGAKAQGHHAIEGVVLGPLSRVGKDLVSPVDELEPLLGHRRLVLVRMIFLSEPSVGLLYLFGNGISGDSEDSIVVLEVRQTS
jgi:hypothetical protein